MSRRNALVSKGLIRKTPNISPKTSISHRMDRPGRVVRPGLEKVYLPNETWLEQHESLRRSFHHPRVRSCDPNHRLVAPHLHDNASKECLVCAFAGCWLVRPRQGTVAQGNISAREYRACPGEERTIATDDRDLAIALEHFNEDTTVVILGGTRGAWGLSTRYYRSLPAARERTAGSAVVAQPPIGGRGHDILDGGGR